MDMKKAQKCAGCKYSYYVIVILTAAVLFLAYRFVRDDTLLFASPGTRYIPSKNLPVPTTVSVQMQDVIGLPLNPLAYYIPATSGQWKEIIHKFNTLVITQAVPYLKTIFPAAIENQSVGGVNTYVITPQAMPHENEDLLLIGLHGGGYMFFGGEAALPECLAMAHYAKYRVLAVDYRMPPEHPFPAALEDVIAVYREVIKTKDAKKIGMFGTSAGGGLLLAAVLKMQDLGLPLPAVLSVGTPWSDLTKTGDTYFSNEYIDDVIITYEGMMKGTVQEYAGTHALTNPYISPVYGTYSKDFPPSILTAGTRDLFLSNTVRVFRKLRQAGIEAELQVFEAMSHAFYMKAYDSAESREAFEEMAKFIHKYLDPKS